MVYMVATSAALSEVDDAGLEQPAMPGCGACARRRCCIVAVLHGQSKQGSVKRIKVATRAASRKKQAEQAHNQTPTHATQSKQGSVAVYVSVHAEKVLKTIVLSLPVPVHSPS